MVAYLSGATLSRALILFPLLATLASPPAAAATSRFAGLKGSPDLRSSSALVLDASGNVIYGKDADAVRPIASITKLMTAMVVLDAGLDLNEKITVTQDDRDRWKATGSRLSYGATLTRREMLLLALVSSENRAAAALGRNYPGGRAAFVEQMNAKAAELGMSRSRFADPAGLRKSPPGDGRLLRHPSPRRRSPRDRGNDGRGVEQDRGAQARRDRGGGADRRG